MNLRKLKVLPNEFQSHLDLHYKMTGFGGHWDEEFEMFESYDDHEVIFNRVGYYKLGKDVWYEFKLKSGSYRAISGGVTAFDYLMDRYNSEEKPISEEDWKMITTLIRKGTIKSNKRFYNERVRRELLNLKRSYSLIFNKD